jgi:type IV pilus assembly protein PilW
MTLIELLVGLVAGLLVSLAAVSSASLFTATQRQGISAAGTGSNIGSVLASVKNDIANGGLGFFGDSRYLCNRLNLGMGPNPLIDGAAFSPISASRDESGNDVLDVVYGSEVTAGASVRLSSTSNGAEAALKSFLPATPGQAVLIASGLAAPCAVRTVTANTPSSSTSKQLLTFASDGLHNGAAFSNNPDYGENSRVSLLGTVQWNRYRLDGTNLRVGRVLDGTDAVLMRNVVAFRVQYGTSADTTTDSLTAWDDPVGAFSTLDQTNMARVRALRIGAVVRSPQPEKPNASGACEATTELPTLFGAPIVPDVPDWQCFRYRSAVVIAPMRNIVYGL